MRVNAVFAGLLLACVCFAQNDEGYGKKIKEFTTEPFFLTDLVDHLPASATVPTPEKFLGHIVGAPNVLTYSAKAAEYLRLLEKSSQRVKVFSMGKSEEGREMVVAVISDEANLSRLPRLKEINATLGDPRKIKDEKLADSLIAEGLPFYWATGGMHAPETGPPEMLMELAYRLAVSEEPFIQTIRKNSVVMLTPVLDVDGRDRVVDIYRYEKANPKKTIPLVYWGHYVAHDDNRDGMVNSLKLSQNVSSTWMDFKPLVFHDLHESVPYLYISTGTGPYNPSYDPLTIDEWHILAYNEIDEMTKRGVPGVWTHGFYDGWAASYGFMIANGHNGIGRFYETFGGNGADTGIQSAGGDSTRQWYRPNPPFPRVRWSIRNNVNLMQSALLLGMNKVATEKEKFLRNYYLKAKRSVAKATTEGPAAYVIPTDSKRATHAGMLLSLLRKQGIEVSTLAADVDTADGKFSKGSYVIRMDQPYSRMADMMLDKQCYNPTDPRSYDDTGWQLGPLFDINVVRVKDVKILALASGGDALAKVPPIVDASKLPRIALVHTWTDTQDEGWWRKAFDELGVKYDYVAVQDIRDSADLKAKYDVIMIPPGGGSAQGLVNGLPKVGDPISWKPTKDYPNLGGPAERGDIRGGIELQGVLNLQKFVGAGGLLICAGESVSLPIDYGLVSGVSVFRPTQLAAPGGVFLTENAAKDSPILAGYGDTLGVYFNQFTCPILQLGGGRGRGGAPTRVSGRGSPTDADVVQGRPPYTPKSLPGDSPENDDRSQNLPRPKILLRYASAEKVLVSGMLDHGEELGGKAALVDCSVGMGHILLFSPNPFWRMETVGSYSLIFNAAMYWNKLK